MSLQNLANNLQSAGRGNDSMLVHMTPGEVHGLQSLAMAHGGSLTINPETGLPEAGFLSSILPMVAGFALGPAGFGLMSSLGAAATVGGISALATGSLQKGLMAGLGAYGGAGIGENIAAQAPAFAAPEQATLANQLAAQTAERTADTSLANLTGLTPEGGLAGFQTTTPLNASSDFLLGGGFNPATSGGAWGTPAVPPALGSGMAPVPTGPSIPVVDYASPWDKLTAGARAIGTDGAKQFAKDNLANIGMAATPFIPGMLKQPTLGSTSTENALIRPYTFNANPTGADKLNTAEAFGTPGARGGPERRYFNQTMTAETPYLAPGPEYNNPSLATGITTPSVTDPYGQFNYWDRYRQPVTAANGGLLAEKTGAIESMSDANAIGANNSYPMGNQPQPAYLLNTARPAAGNVINPSSGMATDPFSGEPRFARGGGISALGGYSDGGRLLRGPGTGLSDGIPAQIGNKQPARLADGEFVIPADVVSAMGGGSTDAGAKKFYAMLDRIRRQAHGKTKQIRKVSDRVLPA